MGNGNGNTEDGGEADGVTVLWSASVSSGGDSETATLPSAGTYTITISPGTLTGSLTYTLS